MFSQLAILNFLKENQEVEEEDLVWVQDLEKVEKVIEEICKKHELNT